MLALHLIPWDPSEWPRGVAVVVGAVVTLLVLLVGSRLYGRRAAVPAHGSRTHPHPPPVPDRPPADPFDHGSVRERRTAPRRQGNPVPVAVAAGNEGAETLRGLVLDRSLGGLRLSLDHDIEEGAVVRLRPSATFEEV